MNKTFISVFCILTLFSMTTSCMKSIPYKKEKIETSNNTHIKDTLKDPYLVYASYTHNFQEIKFSDTVLCQLKAKHSTPYGIQHIVLPFGLVNHVLHKLQELKPDEFKAISNYFLGNTEKQLRAETIEKARDPYSKTKPMMQRIIKYSPQEVLALLEGTKTEVRCILFKHKLDLCDTSIIKSVLFSLQGDQNGNPYTNNVLGYAPDNNSVGDSRFPRYQQEQYEQLQKNAYVKLHKQVLSKEEKSHIAEVKALLSFSTDIENESIKKIKPKLKKMEKKNKYALQLLLAICPHIKNENINQWITAIPAMQKYLSLYIEYNIIQKLKNQQNNQMFDYILRNATRKALLFLTDYSVKKHKSIGSSSTILRNSAETLSRSNSPGLPSPEILKKDTTSQMHVQIQKSLKETKEKRKSHKRKSSRAKKRKNSRKSPKLKKKKIHISPIQIPTSPRKRSNSVADPLSSRREKATPRERAKTDGELTERSKNILNDIEKTKTEIQNDGSIETSETTFNTSEEFKVD